MVVWLYGYKNQKEKGSLYELFKPYSFPLLNMCLAELGVRPRPIASDCLVSSQHCKRCNRNKKNIRTCTH